MNASNAHTGASITQARNPFRRCHCLGQFHCWRFVAVEGRKLWQSGRGRFRPGSASLDARARLPKDQGGLAPKAYKIMIRLGLSSLERDFGIAETVAAGEAKPGNQKDSRRP